MREKKEGRGGKRKEGKEEGREKERGGNSH